MKKIVLIFAILFFFAVLEAENAESKAADPARSPENKAETAECVKKPKSVLFMPSLGFDVASLSLDARFEVDFRVAGLLQESAFYLGLDAGAFYSRYAHERLGFPMHVKFFFDFKQPSHYKALDYAGFWLAVGVAGIRLVDARYDDYIDYDREIYFSVGGGVDMTFKNNIVLRVAVISAFDYFSVYLPDFNIAVGYRF